MDSWGLAPNLPEDDRWQLNPSWGPNAGMLQCWIAQRGFQGNTWANMGASGGVLTLTDLPSNAGWQGFPTRANQPSMRLQDSATPWAQLVWSTSGSTTTTYTTGCWVRLFSHPDGNSRQDVLFRHGGTIAMQFNGDASGKVKMRSFFPATFNSTTLLDLNVWHRCVWTGDGTNLRMYANGVLTDTFANGTAVPPITVIGQYTGARANALHGDIDGPFFVGRTWSAAQVAADYQDGIMGYPGAILPQLEELTDEQLALGNKSFGTLTRSL